LRSQQTPKHVDEVRYRESDNLLGMDQLPNQSWDALYNSQQDEFDPHNIRNMADDSGLFQRSIENIAEQNLIENLLFREDNSGISQGAASFRLLSSAYSFGSQTPREGEDLAEVPKQNKIAKSFKSYILGQDNMTE